MIFFGAKKIKSVELRSTQASTRLRENPYDVGVEVEFVDGSKIDMDSSRVKELELNPKSPTGLSPKQFPKEVRISSDGRKRGLDEQEKIFMDKVKELLGL